MPHVDHTAGCIAATAGTAFAGAALYVSTVQHPALLAAGAEAYSKFFPHMFKRAAKFQGGLALLGAAAAFAQAGKSKDTRTLWILSGLTLASVVPYTLGVMMPTNKAIIQASESGNNSSEGTFQKWAWMHSARVVLPVAAVALSVVAMAVSHKQVYKQ